MSKYAVIKIKGQQYRVNEGDEILVDKLGEDKLEAEVLLFANEGKVKVGKPVVKGAKVNLKIVDKETKGKKLHVVKFRAKSRYRKKIGFRPIYSRLLVEKISG